jgi:MFS family permease
VVPSITRRMLSNLRSFQNPAIPRECRSNFIHLYFDVAWFGVLSGSAVNFLNIYATRLGASGFQIGLLGATSAVANLIFAIPAGQILEKRPISKTVFWNSVIFRVGYLLWIPLPWILGQQGQIWSLITIALLMGVPLTIFTVGYNTLYVAAVPNEWRAYLAGIRNIIFSITFMLSSFVCGWLLEHSPFPTGYQIVFGIGGLSALLSCLHIFFIRPLPLPAPPSVSTDPQLGPIPLEMGHRPSGHTVLRTDIWQTPYAAVLLVLLGLHLGQYLAIPLIPLYTVNVMHLTDEQIGLGTALFYLMVLLGSTQLHRLVGRLGNYKVTGYGMMVMSLYPFLMGLSHQAPAYYIVCAIGGLAWSMFGGAYGNYIFENIPAHDLPAHLAWYNIVLNASILLGSLIGPLIARFIGLGIALLLFGLCRLLAGAAVLKWGRGIRLPGER